MIYRLYPFILAASILLLPSCSGTGKDITDYVDFIPVKEGQNDNWGMVDLQGKYLFEDKFDNEPTLAINGYFTVLEDEGYSVYKAEKKPKLVNHCEGLFSVGVMNEGVMPISKEGGRIALINEEGGVVATLRPIKGKEILVSASWVSEGLLAVVNEDGKCGFVDKKGKLAIDFKFDNCSPYFIGNYIIASKTDKESQDDYSYADSKYYIIDKKGEIIANIKSGLTPLSWNFLEDVVVVRDEEDRYGFVNTKGEYHKLPTKVEGVGQIIDRYYSFVNGDRWGIMNLSNDEIIIPAKWKYMNILPSNKFLVADEDDNYFILDKEGEKIERLNDYESVATIFNKLIVAKEGQYYKFLRNDGKSLSTEEFADYGVSISRDANVQSDYPIQYTQNEASDY